MNSHPVDHPIGVVCYQQGTIVQNGQAYGAGEMCFVVVNQEAGEEVVEAYRFTIFKMQPYYFLAYRLAAVPGTAQGNKCVIAVFGGKHTACIKYQLHGCCMCLVGEGR